MKSGVETLLEGSLTQQASGRLIVRTDGRSFTEITEPVARWVMETGILQGLITIFCRHTSASLTIQENADFDVRVDLLAALDRLAPRHETYIHDTEGPDDMPAHIKAMLTGSSLSVPVLEGQMALGTWQGLYVVEHRDRPHSREILLHIVGS